VKRCTLSSVRFAYVVRAPEEELTSLFGRGRAEFRRDYSTTHGANELASLHQERSSNWAVV
jgi:hypothetical protein